MLIVQEIFDIDFASRNFMYKMIKKRYFFLLEDLLQWKKYLIPKHSYIMKGSPLLYNTAISSLGSVAGFFGQELRLVWSFKEENTFMCFHKWQNSQIERAAAYARKEWGGQFGTASWRNLARTWVTSFGICELSLVRESQRSFQAGLKVR